MLTISGAALALAACAATPEADPAPQPRAAAQAAPGGQTTGYLQASALSGKDILPGPPAAGSPYDVADRANYDATRSLEGSARWKLAQQDNDLWQGGALKRFSCAMGKDVNAQATPVAWKLLHKIELDVRTIGTPAKNFFDRKRPALGNDKAICVPREKWLETNASYPSGHSMVAWSWALILTEAAPASADALLKLGQESGDSRVVCGVHFPSDVEAGRTLAAGMVARLHADPAFMADLAAAKRELATAPAASGCGA
ncbi:acid phosphatase [Phenylobacterium sp. VNQ135]|uniref:acid phosphatase n=1 Tax=Phenylobacterium sp. VNQ135 TaxID=3400922 RepID=UPI003BFF3EA3